MSPHTSERQTQRSPRPPVHDHANLETRFSAPVHPESRRLQTPGRAVDRRAERAR